MAEWDTFGRITSDTKNFTVRPALDKNSPSALKQLRWAIYEAVEIHHARSAASELNQKIEDLFKEYTNS